MDDFNADLGPALKYGRLRTQTEWLPLVEEYLSHHQRSGGATDKQTPLVLADFLQDEGDPRAEVLRRGANDMAVTGLLPHLGKGYREAHRHFVEGPFGGIGFSIHHKQHLLSGELPDGPPQKLVMELEFGRKDGRGIHRYVEVSPEEAKTVVGHLPEEDRGPATSFLHFHYPELVK